MSYQGYTNWATWEYMLQLQNDELLYHYAQRAAREAKDIFYLTSKLKDDYEETVWNIVNDLSESFAKRLLMDCVTNTVDDINFREIAEHLWEEFCESEEEEEDELCGVEV